MAQNQPVGAQIAAVESGAEHLLVIAPPGCGKTEVLAMRADRLIRTGLVRPKHRLLAITFTNRARDNLRSRLLQQLGPARMRDAVTVMNLHELSARLVEAHHRVIGLEPGFSFPHPAWQRRAVAAITKDRGEQGAIKEYIASLGRQPLTDEELIHQIETRGFPSVLKLERRRRSDQYIDYGDLQRYAQLILRNHRVATLFQNHFDAIIVDEFQDLSRQQYEITSLVCTRNSTYVGDPYQGIFGWAGADPGYVHTDLLKRAGETINLDVSFRSSPAVLDVVNAISVSLGSAGLRAAFPDDWGPSRGHSYAAAYPTDVAEADGIVALTDYLADKYPGDTIGVICRTGYRRGALELAYQHASHQPQFWDIALDTPRVVRLLKSHARQVDAAAGLPDQVEELRQRVTDSIPPTDIDTLKEVSDACQQLLELDRVAASVRQLMDRVRDTQSIAAIADGVHVLNAHTGKGQQFDWVIVMGLEDGHVPDRRSIATDEGELEEKRVLLVMLSRARKGLFLTRAASNTNQWGKTFRNMPSRWWDVMAGAVQKLTPEVAAVMKVPVSR